MKLMHIPDINLVSTKSRLLEEEALVFLNFSGDAAIKKQLSRVLQKHEVERLMAYVAKRKFTGNLKQVLYLPVFDDTMVVLVGLGGEKSFTLESFRKASNTAVEVLKQLNIETGVIVPPNTKKTQPRLGVAAIAEGVLLGSYAFDKYKSKPEDDEKPYELKNINIAYDSLTKALEAAVDRTLMISQGVYLARDLENENSDQINPKTFAQEVLRHAKSDKKLKVTIIEGADVKKKKLNLLHAVGRGAEVGPCLILLEYKGNTSKKIDAALVGKGITFDTGGLNLKPPGPMTNQMHIDMAGAATVLSTILTASRLKLKKNLIGVMALAENAVDSKSYKPGSIIVSHSGKSVEISNTDAEGRLVLADALSYVTTEYQPEYVIDLATLTGAVLVALGSEAAGLFTNDDGLKKNLLEAAEATHERLWELPLYEEFDDEIKGQYSDLKNLGSKLNGGYASSSIGATFLKQFIHDAKWAHLDIAGMAILDNKKDYMPANGSGYGVRLLVEYLS